MSDNISAEQKRLIENAKLANPLEKWGPYLSERQWGTVREDYSAEGWAWGYFPHDHAISRAYLWGEDGIGGICDYLQNICFAPAMWNGKDPFIKERLFGLANGEGNHGEDVKELYYYLDNLPSHYYMKYLYKYPQNPFPYEVLRKENKARGFNDPEFEILDTDAFANNQYFDVYIEYAKNNSEDIFIRLHICNRGTNAAEITMLPTIWFYNRWQYSHTTVRPIISAVNSNTVELNNERTGKYYFYYQDADDALFAENETNFKKLFKGNNKYPVVKDSINDAIVSGKVSPALRRKKAGTKFSAVYTMNIDAGETKTIRLRLCNQIHEDAFGNEFDALFDLRKQEADEYYNQIIAINDAETYNIKRQAYAGILWTKQFYYYDVEWWLKGNDGISPAFPERATKGRNHSWQYLKNQDVISMPDKWEYPWYAAWDLAFHTISMALTDISFAKHQLILLMREWYMNQDGQLPAYEWDLNGVNPPVHAFAALEVYRIEQRINGKSDISFLKRIFQKLIINFTWWVNRKDAKGNSIFEGGFLGLDNIGLFNRNEPLAPGLRLEQSDGTSWMGMYALNMMEIAFEIATHDPDFEDSVTKFYEHFVIIAESLNQLDLWNTDDNFFYDVLNVNNEEKIPLKVRSIVGLIPLFAVSLFNYRDISKLPDFMHRMDWFERYRRRNNKYLPNEDKSDKQSLLLSLVNRDRLQLILQRLVDEDEFFSPHGIRSLSKVYEQQPYSLTIWEQDYAIAYDPADSTSDMFGGNSNWRGPVWVPINYLIIKSLKRFGEFYGDEITVEFPKNSGQRVNLSKLGEILTVNILNIFRRNANDEMPVYGQYNWFYQKPENRGLILFHEYFDGDNGRGLGASHQTGWTALILNLLKDFGQ